ncbi:MAG: DUF4012 domain-containing protein [Microthrixaceae bacterium]
MITLVTTDRPPVDAPRRHRGSSPVDRWGVAAVLTAGALVAALALSAAPTGLPVVDAAYRVGLVVVCGLAGARARRWFLLATPAVLLIGSGPLGAVACLAAAGGAAVLLVRELRNRVAGAAIGTVSGLAALALVRPGVNGATALLAAIALAPLFVSGYRNSRRRTRRRVRWVALGLGLVALWAVLAAVLFGVTEQGRLRTAAADAREAAAGIGSGKGADTVRLERSAEAFAGAVRRTDAWWMWPSRALPVLGPNLTAVRSAAVAADDLSATAADLSSSVDFTSVRRPDGGVDLAALASFAGPADRAVGSLDRALARVNSSNSAWLLLPLRDRLTDLRGVLEDVGGNARTAALATRTLPGMLGADGPRRYLILLGNPAELRDLGGHLGNWVEVVAVDGKLTVADSGTPLDLYGPASARPPAIADAEAYPASLISMAPDRFVQNWAASPDMPTVARLAAELYPQARPGKPLDAVFYADPWAFASLLELTGPVEVPGSGVRVDSGNAVDFLTKGQYAQLGEDPGGVVSELVDLALDRAVGRQLPTPDRLADTLGRAATRGHLIGAPTDGAAPAVGQMLDRAGLSRSLARPADSDLLAVLNRNANPSKVDAYLQRDVEARYSWDPRTGAVQARVEVDLRNTAPAAGIPPVAGQAPGDLPFGTNRTQLAVVSGLRPVSMKLDGVTLPMAVNDDGDGLRRGSTVIDVPPGGSRKVVVLLDGRVRPGESYRLRWLAQPLLLQGRADVAVNATRGSFPGRRATERERVPTEGTTDVVTSIEPGSAG